MGKEQTVTVVDIECTVSGDDRSPSPYIPANKLVSVGYSSNGTSNYLCFNHDTEPATEGGRETLQKVLDKTSTLVGHNIKFDLSWLLECGYTYDEEIYDTMIYEYVKAGGKPNVRIDLSSSCKRHGLTGKHDTTQEYFSNGIGFEKMPWEVVEEYGRNDVEITRQLHLSQMEA